jgi:hypothetical protein
MDPDSNTERRLAKLRAKHDAKARGIEYVDPTSYPRSSPTATAASSAADRNSSWKLPFAIAACVGTGLLVRSLLKGTAPSQGSRYSKFVQQQEAQATNTAGWRPSQSASSAYGQHQQSSQQYHKQSYQQSSYQQSQQTQQQQQQQQSHQDPFTRRSDSHSAQSDSSSARQAAYDRKYRQAQSDYEKYERLQQQARENWKPRAGEPGYREDGSPLGAQTGEAYIPFRDHDPIFEQEMDRARADYVQSKFHALKSSKRILKYQTWAQSRKSGSGGAFGEDGDGEEEEGEAEESMRRRFGAWRNVQRQMATHPKFVQARQLVFGSDGGSSQPPPSNSDAALASAYTSSDGSLPFLTSQVVRSAYFTRAKTCHPDVAGGDARRFQELTDAYELLIETIEPMERTQTGAPTEQGNTATGAKE